MGSNPIVCFMRTVHTFTQALMYHKEAEFKRDLPYDLCHPELEIGDIIVDTTGAYEVTEIQMRIFDSAFGDKLKTYTFKKTTIK